MHHPWRVGLAGLVVLLVLSTLNLTPVQAATSRCFTETGNCISDRFLSFWEENGGLPVFGFPIGPAQQEQTPEGRFWAQSFERNRFELHTENPAPYDVLLGRYGAEKL